MFRERPFRGDGIPMHEHETELALNITVVRGSVEVYGPDKAGSVTLRPGDAPYTPSGLHEIAALEDNSQTLHLYLNGMPEEYQGLPEEAFDATRDWPITIPLE